MMMIVRRRCIQLSSCRVLRTIPAIALSRTSHRPTSSSLKARLHDNVGLVSSVERTVASPSRRRHRQARSKSTSCVARNLLPTSDGSTDRIPVPHVRVPEAAVADADDRSTRRGFVPGLHHRQRPELASTRSRTYRFSAYICNEGLISRAYEECPS